MSLIELRGMGREAIASLLDRAEAFLGDDGVFVPPDRARSLEGKAIALLFFEPSTRTRISFELAAKRLGATTVLMRAEGSSLQKGETVLDTCLNLEAMGIDAFIVRHRERDTPHVLAEHLSRPIINAGNGSGEHPSQGLLDALTLRRAIGDERGLLEGKTVAIIGDIVRSRVARSDVHAFTALGARVVLGGPPTMVPARGDDGWGEAEVVTSRREAVAEADAVVVLRIQRERMNNASVDTDAYVRDWNIDEGVVAEELPAHAKIMHPGPVIRGEELSSAVADGPRSLILEQVRCGVAMRQAILGALLEER